MDIYHLAEHFYEGNEKVEKKSKIPYINILGV